MTLSRWRSGSTLLLPLLLLLSVTGCRVEPAGGLHGHPDHSAGHDHSGEGAPAAEIAAMVAEIEEARAQLAALKESLSGLLAAGGTPDPATVAAIEDALDRAEQRLVQAERQAAAIAEDEQGAHDHDGHDH